jgi:D-alanyl-D-alanine dipeptidase
VILLSDPRVAAIPAADNGDELIDVREIRELTVDSRQEVPSGAHAMLRRAVADRLLQAQETLPAGLRLLIVEGYRDLTAQRAIFDGYRAELAGLYPDWTAERLHTETSKFCSPVEVAPHSTGGALDLTLITPSGAELDMGTVIDATPEASRNACFTAAANISPRARVHRQILCEALTGAGLVNYPTEWWHWSYGDRYWALTTGAPAAIYGPVELGAELTRTGGG